MRDVLQDTLQYSEQKINLVWWMLTSWFLVCCFLSFISLLHC